MKKRVLICGVGGQDGAWLAHFLLHKGYEVWGTSRDAQGGQFSNLTRLGIRDQVHLLSMVPEDFLSVTVAIKKSAPDEVYFLSGQSSVGLSFDQPAETIKSFSLGTLHMLEACRLADGRFRLYNAGSSECFGDTHGQPASEACAFEPRSPYAVAKSTAHWLVANYREAYGLFACTGILFNHDSPLRPERFVTQKIARSVVRIANGSEETLKLGRLDIVRDWGWAPEYVEAMWMMLQQDSADDYVVATGKSHSLEEFVEAAFSMFGLDWRKHVEQDRDLFRPTDILQSRANATKAAEKLQWRPRYKMADVVRGMIIGVNEPDPALWEVLGTRGDGRG